MFYAPVEIGEGELFIDVDSDVVAVVSKNGNREAETEKRKRHICSQPVLSDQPWNTVSLSR